MKRRDFLAATALSTALSAQQLPGGSARFEDANESSRSPVGFPEGDYTPFGYLDNPWHTWELNRSGVLRSTPGIGLCLYYPAGPGGYFDFPRNNIYAASLELAFSIDGQHVLSGEDYASVKLHSPYHSKNLLGYAFEIAGMQVQCTLVQVGEDTIAARVELHDTTGRGRPARILAKHTYRLGGANWWGRDGLAGRYDAASGAVVTRSFAAGTVFALTGSRTASAHFVDKDENTLKDCLSVAPKTGEATSYHPDPLYAGLRVDMDIPARGRETLSFILARGPNEVIATDRALVAFGRVGSSIAAKRGEDDAFWRAAPQLSGDWPRHWRNGWVYDFETLRMMIRQPAGLYKHPWDAMQIQAPRNVLAETSIDCWALSYADPEAAKNVFAGQFLDAIAENIPCMRENGVMNMVAADGSACGTSISWCHPYFCASSIFERTRDLVWLRTIYPSLARLLRWTIANRSDSGGYLIGKCSWETGMDASKRFLISQPTGGELTEFIRLVELQAAASYAGAVLARFADLTGAHRDIPEWKKIQQAFQSKTQELWKDDWFHDFDSRNSTLVTSTGHDPAQAAPAFLGIASEEQLRLMKPALRQMLEDSKKRNEAAQGWEDGLAWSSLVLPYLESVWAAGDGELASEVVYTIAERIYTSMDRRALEASSAQSKRPQAGWPGVSCEIWGQQGAFGGEGYGWGAVLPAHMIRSVIGFRESADPNLFWLCPNLPAKLVTSGKTFGIRNLACGTARLNLQYHCQGGSRVHVDAEWVSGARTVSIAAANGQMVPLKQEKKQENNRWSFDAENHARYQVRL